MPHTEQVRADFCRQLLGVKSLHLMDLYMKWYQNVPRLGLYIYTRKYPLDSSLGTTPFRIVPLCIDTTLPAPLPPLERVLEVLFSRRVKHILRLALDLLHGFKTATLQLQVPLREEKDVRRGQLWRVGRVHV